MDKRSILIVALLLLIFGVVMRLMPHLPNLTPITAIALVSSWYLSKRWGLILPLITIAITDLFIGFYDWRIMLSVYASFAIIGLLGWIAVKYRSAFSIGVATIGSSVLFFLITNAAVWLFSPWYEKNLAGLLYSYELGLPFFRNMLAGDIGYTVALVCAIEVVLVLTRTRRIGSLLKLPSSQTI